MNRSEIAKLLAAAAALDQRTVGQADVSAWHAVLDDLAFDDACEAVRRWYRDNDRRVMPSNIRDIVRHIGNQRAEARRHADYYGLPERPGFGRHLALVTAAHDIHRALPGVPCPPELRDPHAKTRVAALAVPCTWCHAGRHQPCVVPQAKRAPAGGVHQARIDAAAKLAEQTAPHGPAAT